MFNAQIKKEYIEDDNLNFVKIRFFLAIPRRSDRPRQRSGDI